MRSRCAGGACSKRVGQFSIMLELGHSKERSGTGGCLCLGLSLAPGPVLRGLGIRRHLQLALRPVVVKGSPGPKGVFLSFSLSLSARFSQPTGHSRPFPGVCVFLASLRLMICSGDFQLGGGSLVQTT